MQETLSQVADDDIEQSGLTLWSFGELPKEYSQKRSGFEVKAYPTLVDQKDSVAIQLVESPVAQQQLMWAGQRRLVLLNVPSPSSICRRSCRTRPSSDSISTRLARWRS